MVTGATSGMGFVTAMALAKEGARLVIVGRNQKKCVSCVDKLKKESGNDNVEYLLADLTVQDDIRNLAREFLKKHDQLHLLVNNAGGYFVGKEFTADGIEMTFALNHLAPFLLTNLLLDTIKKSAPARIVNVSSAEHFRVKYEPDKLISHDDYIGLGAYSKSKLYIIMFTYELAKRLKGSGVTANVLHPGWVATNIGKNNGVIAKIALPVMQLHAISVEEGAATPIYLATSPDLDKVTGQYFNKLNPDKSSADSYNEDYTKDLWEKSKKMCGLG